MTLIGSSRTRKCPGCGTIIAVPADCETADAGLDGRRLDQLAQALCGCWVVSLPESGLARLLGAIKGGDDAHAEHCLRSAAGGL